MTSPISPNPLGLLTNQLLKNLQQAPKSLVLPESSDPRVLRAAIFLLEARALTKLYLMGAPHAVLALAKSEGLALEQHSDRIIWVDESYRDLHDITKAHLLKHAAIKGKELTDGDQASRDGLYHGGMLLKLGHADACVAGSLATTANVIKAALRTVGPQPGIAAVSGSFLLERGTELYLFADAAILIEPTVEQITAIAKASLETWRRLCPERAPGVAFLSFSTNGSANHPHATKMADAWRAFHDAHPEVVSAGEVQFDAAFVKEIGARKLPGNSLPGAANIFIFPDLNSGNIAYKIAQRLGQFAAYGPLIQGTAKPYFDLSRGASWQDIAATATIALNLNRA